MIGGTVRSCASLSLFLSALSSLPRPCATYVHAATGSHVYKRGPMDASSASSWKSRPGTRFIGLSQLAGPVAASLFTWDDVRTVMRCRAAPFAPCLVGNDAICHRSRLGRVLRVRTYTPAQKFLGCSPWIVGLIFFA